MKWENMKNVEKKFLLISSIAMLLTLIVGVSYAYIAYTTKQKGINVVGTDCIKMEMEELTNAIQLKNAQPLTDEVGEKAKPFRFKITNTCGVGINYDVNLEVIESEKRIESQNIAVKVDEDSKSILSENKGAEVTIEENENKGVEAYTIKSGELTPYGSVIHEVRIWLDESAGNETQNGTFYSKIVIDGIQNQITMYQEEILNGAAPVLGDNLIPVEIDETGKVTKANVHFEWYSYEEKKWANAVILEDESIKYDVYEEIPEENIESYFVWIPKYSYQLWDLGEYDSLTEVDESKIHEISIKFGLENTNDDNEGECTTPMTSGSSGNCQVGDYMTPPAFITMGTNGLWVGKFESGYKGATSPGEAQVNSNESNKLQIKPNVYSWRDIQPSNAHLVSYNYQRELDSHMMKNTEWGAVAYLQHSKYGSSESVRINNNASFITGYAAKSEPTCGGYMENSEECNPFDETGLRTDGAYTINYTNPESQVASTTGNYTGIYDMSGGAWEYMMSIVLDSLNAAPLSGYSGDYHSGFNGCFDVGGTYVDGINFPNKKYYEEYLYDANYDNFSRRILGDGTGEFGPFASTQYGNEVGSWYTGDSWFPYGSGPWFLRGGSIHYGQSAGVFLFGYSYGHNDINGGFRVVLAI